MGNTDYGFYLAILLKRLPYLLAIAALVTGVAVVVAYLMPPLYRASAKILVEPPQIPAGLARSTFETNAIEQLQIIQQEITTRDNLLELARRLQIFGAAKAKLSDTDIVENLRARTSLERVQFDGLREGSGATVFSVSFLAKDPELAARVVNELVAFILSENVGMRTSKAEDTTQFFDKEVSRLGAALELLEAQLLEFRKNNQDALPDSMDFRRTQQMNQQERLLLLEREESALRIRRATLVRTFEATGQMVGAGPVSPEQEMLRDMKRALAEQLSIFSEKSPQIVTLRAQIASVQEKLQATQALPNAPAETSQLDVQLADIDGELASIAREKVKIGENLAELARSIAATPENETKLNAMERQRANIQAQYNAAVAKLAEASTGEQIEIRSKGGRFSLVEPAAPPEGRISPNRKKIAGAGLAAGLLLGLGFVVVLELANRSIRRPNELAERLQSQPLAVIPYIWLAGEKRAAHRRLAVGFAAAAAIAVAAAFFVQHYRLPLASAAEQFFGGIDPSGAA